MMCFQKKKRAVERDNVLSMSFFLFYKSIVLSDAFLIFVSLNVVFVYLVHLFDSPLMNSMSMLHNVVDNRYRSGNQHI